MKDYYSSVSCNIGNQKPNYSTTLDKGGELENFIAANTQDELDQKVHEYLYANAEDYKLHWDENILKGLEVESITSSNWGWGCVSLVGCGSNPQYPLSFGNYFSLMLLDRNMPIINMWYENLKEAVSRFGVKELTFEIYQGGKGVIITSPKIPKEWYIEKLFMKYNCNLNHVDQYLVRKHNGLL